MDNRRPLPGSDPIFLKKMRAIETPRFALGVATSASAKTIYFAGLVRFWRNFVGCYRLQTDDMDLLRAQFREFIQQIPLLYFILSCNAAAVAYSVSQVHNILLSDGFPLAMCIIATVRGIWWARRRHAQFPDEQIRKHIRNTSTLAAAISIAFMLWGLALYHYGDVEMRGHLVFFLALTQIVCVFLLTPVRSAALRVATIGVAPFVIYFLFADGQRMVVEAVILALVGLGMVATLIRYHNTFDELIQSQRTLRTRQAETQRLSDENRRIAFTDPLSGLPNRRALLARLDEAYGQPNRAADCLAIIFVDLDGFKTINDSHGHQFGDAVICEVGRQLQELRSGSGLLVRMGGDEFAILVEGMRASARAGDLAKRICDKIGEPLHVDGRQFRVGASIGIATDDDGWTSTYELLRQADTAMYRVKENGKGGIQYYHPSFDVDRLWRQQIEDEIRCGIERGEFAVYYQPLIDARSGRRVAVEALARWPGRKEGALQPDDFIEIAEAGGLIHRLGLYILRQACLDIRDVADCMLSVNVSPAQFRHPEFEHEVAQVISETGFPAHRLQLEITEKYLIDHPERARGAIAMLKALGVTFALDDFGTGFTSIAYLQSYGFDCIKIDKSLSARLGEDPRASMLISGMVYMASGLDMRVVAEGVESREQASLLRVAGCHELQGYLFGRPAPLSELLENSETVPGSLLSH